MTRRLLVLKEPLKRAVVRNCGAVCASEATSAAMENQWLPLASCAEKSQMSF
jgi:hypothetical protein